MRTCRARPGISSEYLTESDATADLLMINRTPAAEDPVPVPMTVHLSVEYSEYWGQWDS